MREQELNILLIEDNPGDVRLIKDMLHECAGVSFNMEAARHLSIGLEILARGGIDVALLDLSLPDSHGMETYERFRAQAPNMPVVILTDLDDEGLAIQAVQKGAQDYLVKLELSQTLLGRALRYAYERNRLLMELHNLALIDDLTGLYNRRGFFTFANQQMKLIQRTQGEFLIVYADLDDLKEINDVYGHQEGDKALCQVAEIFRKAFRKSDIIARMGGDEFVILVWPVDQALEKIIHSRVNKFIDEHNALNLNPYKLSLSLGVKSFNTVSRLSIEQMLESVDKDMYTEKQGKE